MCLYHCHPWRIGAQRETLGTLKGGCGEPGKGAEGGWCNLIGRHSCINSGIVEFLPVPWIWLCKNGPSSPPKMGHFPHVSLDMTTNPATQVQYWKYNTAEAGLCLFSSCEILPLWPSLLKTSSKSCCLTCQKQPNSLSKAPTKQTNNRWQGQKAAALGANTLVCPPIGGKGSE